MTGKYAFYGGCFIPIRAPHIEYVTRRLMPQLGVELHDVRGFTCCPEPVGFGLHEKMAWLTIAARNISLAEEAGLDILTVCNGCFYTFKHTLEELENPETRGRVNEALAETGHEFRGRARVRHFVQVLDEDVGLGRLGQAVVAPLTGLKVAAHTGCHYSNRFGSDAETLDRLVSTLGAESLDYRLKNLCCGWMIGGYGQPEEGYAWIRDRVGSMRGAGADCVSVICPQCFHQFDTGQLTASRKVDITSKIPVLFYLQLMGLAMGFSLEDMQYGSHRIRDPGLEEKIRAVQLVKP